MTQCTRFRSRERDKRFDRWLNRFSAAFESRSLLIRDVVRLSWMEDASGCRRNISENKKTAAQAAHPSPLKRDECALNAITTRIIGVHERMHRLVSLESERIIGNTVERFNLLSFRLRLFLPVVVCFTVLRKQRVLNVLFPEGKNANTYFSSRQKIFLNIFTRFYRFSSAFRVYFGYRILFLLKGES